MAEPTRSGIPTTYRGTNFRSRLEARWAAFFDLVGWTWTYEPLDADGYIPDFLIRGPSPMFVEVGPCVTSGNYLAKAGDKAGSRARVLGHDLLVAGVSPLAPIADSVSQGHGWALKAGLLGENDGTGFAWGAAIWSPCRATGLAVFHSWGSYGHRPCSDNHGHSGGPDALEGDDARAVERLWAEAGNRVQWRRAA